jgi:hypothetical protein
MSDTVEKKTSVFEEEETFGNDPANLLRVPPLPDGERRLTEKQRKQTQRYT